MSEIAPLTTNACFQRGISIMRLALGYKTGLPKDWKIDRGGKDSPYTIEDELQAILQSFPCHRVRIICSDATAKCCGLKRNQYIQGYRANLTKFGNTYIFAISLMHNSNGACHFLLGNPISDLEPFIRYAVVVSIKEYLDE